MESPWPRGTAPSSKSQSPAPEDDEAQKLRDLVNEVGESSASANTLAPTGKCLARAREIDGQFREALVAAESEGIESWNHLTRSRFRHLRAFAGLWLLFDALGGK